MIRGRGFNRRGRPQTRDFPAPRERSPVQKILRNRFEDLEEGNGSNNNDNNGNFNSQRPPPSKYPRGRGGFLGRHHQQNNPRFPPPRFNPPNLGRPPRPPGPSQFPPGPPQFTRPNWRQQNAFQEQQEENPFQQQREENPFQQQQQQNSLQQSRQMFGSSSAPPPGRRPWEYESQFMNEGPSDNKMQRIEPPKESPWSSSNSNSNPWGNNNGPSSSSSLLKPDYLARNGNGNQPRLSFPPPQAASTPQRPNNAYNFRVPPPLISPIQEINLASPPKPSFVASIIPRAPDNFHTETPPADFPRKNPSQPSAEVVKASPAVSKVSNELRFIEMTAKFGLNVKCTPGMVNGDDGNKLLYFKVEINRNNETVVATGPHCIRIDEARERAYEIACNKALETFGTESLTRLATQEEGQGQRSSALLPLPSEAPRSALLQTPKALLPQPQPRTCEDKFKDYMDTLHMQCWLKPRSKIGPRGSRHFAFEVEIQSYDKKFHEFYVGSYTDTEDAAKESGFEMACKGLERTFGAELKHVMGETIAPNQRAFMDLRSLLGLKIRCLPEIQLDVNNAETYAFNIQFSRGADEPEVVYGEFLRNESDAKERAFELASVRVKYLYGPELEQLEGLPTPERGRINPPMPPRPPSGPPELSSPHDDRLLVFNPHSIRPQHRTTSTAMVPPRIQPLMSTPRQDFYENSPRYFEHPSTSAYQSSSSPPHQAEYGRTHEYRFKELANLLAMEFNVRKIPQLEGSHKIQAFQVDFQGRNGRFGPQRVRGEYSRDEGSARESAFKYASDQLNSTYGYQLTQLGLNPRGSF